MYHKKKSDASNRYDESEKARLQVMVDMKRYTQINDMKRYTQIDRDIGGEEGRGITTMERISMSTLGALDAFGFRRRKTTANRDTGITAYFTAATFAIHRF